MCNFPTRSRLTSGYICHVEDLAQMTTMMCVACFSELVTSDSPGGRFPFVNHSLDLAPGLVFTNSSPSSPKNTSHFSVRLMKSKSASAVPFHLPAANNLQKGQLILTPLAWFLSPRPSFFVLFRKVHIAPLTIFHPPSSPHSFVSLIATYQVSRFCRRPPSSAIRHLYSSILFFSFLKHAPTPKTAIAPEIQGLPGRQLLCKCHRH